MRRRERERDEKRRRDKTDTERRRERQSQHSFFFSFFFPLGNSNVVKNQNGTESIRLGTGTRLASEIDVDHNNKKTEE